jgi:pyruvate,orthophosphate dikinase
MYCGAGQLHVDAAGKKVKVAGSDIVLKEGDMITLNGTKGNVYNGALTLMDASENPRFQSFMKIVDKSRKMGVRTNAETPADAKIAREMGAEGIGLFRTEHMFYGEGSDKPLFLLRKMILSASVEAAQALNGSLYLSEGHKTESYGRSSCTFVFSILLHEFVPRG